VSRHGGVKSERLTAEMLGYEDISVTETQKIVVSHSHVRQSLME
jgi:hypothetical protein